MQHSDAAGELLLHGRGAGVGELNLADRLMVGMCGVAVMSVVGENWTADGECGR
jgi:hypothetical protein